MVPVSFFLPLIATHAPHVSDPVIESAILRAAAYFCERTGIWRDVIETDPVSSASTEVEYFLPRSQRLVSLVKVLVGREEMRLAGDEILFPERVDCRPRAVALINDRIIFDAPLSLGDRVLAYGTFAPSLEGYDLPDLFKGEWHNALVSGALAELFRYAPPSSHDYQLSVHHDAMFEAAIAQATSRARAGRTHAVRSVKYGGL